MNTKNESPLAILKSCSHKGIRSQEAAEKCSIDGQTYTFPNRNPVTISDNLIKALFILKNHNESQRSLDAYAQDYINTKHQESKGKNPIANPAKVLTAQEYLENCYKSGLDRSNINLLSSAMSEADKLTTASTKAELQAGISRFQAIFITGEQSEHYDVINKNEQADLEAFNKLKDAGFTNIERRGTSLNATIALADAQIGMKALQEIGFNLVSSKNSEDFTSLLVFFNEETPVAI